MGMTSAIVAPVTDGLTYRRLAYLLLAFPLGVAWFVFYVTGLSVGLGLAITVIGIPIVAAMLASVVPLATLERGLANALLGEHIARPARAEQSEGFWASLKRILSAGSTWKGLGFLLARFPLGVFSFSLAVSGLAATLALATAPLHYWAEPLQLGLFKVDTLGEALAVVPVGIVLTVVMLHITNALARAYGAFARVSLG
jgi:hypothetical protein